MGRRYVEDNFLDIENNIQGVNLIIFETQRISTRKCIYFLTSIADIII